MASGEKPRTRSRASAMAGMAAPPRGVSSLATSQRRPAGGRSAVLGGDGLDAGERRRRHPSSETTVPELFAPRPGRSARPSCRPSALPGLGSPSRPGRRRRGRPRRRNTFGSAACRQDLAREWLTERRDEERVDGRAGVSGGSGPPASARAVGVSSAGGRTVPTVQAARTKPRTATVARRVGMPQHGTRRPSRSRDARGMTRRRTAGPVGRSPCAGRRGSGM